MKVSFDFDSTLQREDVQEIAKAFIACNTEVFITTSRSETQTNNIDLFEVALKLGIPKNRIVFTNYQDKAKYLKDFAIHFDDDAHEIDMLLLENTKCIGALLPLKNDLQTNLRKFL
jgi:hypothetical protein